MEHRALWGLYVSWRRTRRVRFFEIASCPSSHGLRLRGDRRDADRWASGRSARSKMHGWGEPRWSLHLLLFAAAGASCRRARRPRRGIECSGGAVILPRPAIRSCQRLSCQTRRSTCLEQQRAFPGNLAWIPYWRGGRRHRQLRHDIDCLRRYRSDRLYNKLGRCTLPDAGPNQSPCESDIAAVMDLAASTLAGSGEIHTVSSAAWDHTKLHKSECRDRFRTMIGRYADEGLVKICVAANGWTLLRVKQLLHSERVRRRAHRNFAAGLPPHNRSRLALCEVVGGLGRLGRTHGVFRRSQARSRLRAITSQLICRFRLPARLTASPA